MDTGRGLAFSLLFLTYLLLKDLVPSSCLEGSRGVSLESPLFFPGLIPSAFTWG